jgi:hypothetical protein
LQEDITGLIDGNFTNVGDKLVLEQWDGAPGTWNWDTCDQLATNGASAAGPKWRSFERYVTGRARQNVEQGLRLRSALFCTFSRRSPPTPPHALSFVCPSPPSQPLA